MMCILKYLRHTMILCAVLLPCVSLCQNARTGVDTVDFQVLFDTSMQQGVACYRIPALVTAINGDLIATIDERVPSCGDLKWNRDINIVIRRSHDNGASWGPIERLVDYPDGQSASDPSMIVDQVTGAIFLFFNYMDLDKERDVYYLKVMRSDDNGQSWSQPRNITAQITRPEWHGDFKFITSGRGTQTRSGQLLHTLVNLNHGMHLFSSDDHGATWHLIETPIRPANESKVLELSDGTWMVNSRVQNEGLRYVHLSRDHGRTWESSADPVLVDPGCNASLLRYSSVLDGGDKNRIVFSHANSTGKRQNLTVRISYDEGTTWTTGKTVYAGSAAYSSMTRLANGDIGLFFEKDDYRENVFVRLTLVWLTDGQDGR